MSNLRLGFREAGLATSDLHGWIAFLTDVAGYEVLWQGPTAMGFKRLWSLDESEPVMECLLACPGSQQGMIRLFGHPHSDQPEIRGAVSPLDAGGLFDLNVRVHSMAPFLDLLESREWGSIGPPTTWQFGASKVTEWLATGPDAVTIALIERIEPPLEGFPDFERFSHVFNSSQIAHDMARSVAFYEALGFKQMVHREGPLPGVGGEVLGLSPEEAPITPIELVILHPSGEDMNGSIELARIEKPGGRDLSSQVRPTQLGLNLLRFPVDDLDGFADHLDRQGIEIEPAGVVESRLEPWGDVRALAVRSPDGAWLEFIQLLSPPASSAY